ncbi:MAG: hypothetical protein K5866_04215 [Treponema sp.]|nr:hypothetical protein [Treponema sp.]
MKKSILVILLISLFSLNLFADDSSTSTSPKAYDDDEFPQALLDLRRFEIITLGSMPFVMLDTTLAYSAYKYASGQSSSFNFLSSSEYDNDETKKIILTSLGISASIGLTDFIVRIIKRSKAKKASKNLYNENLNIYEQEPQEELFEEERPLPPINDPLGPPTGPENQNEENLEADQNQADKENLEADDEVIEVIE